MNDDHDSGNTKVIDDPDSRSMPWSTSSLTSHDGNFDYPTTAYIIAFVMFFTFALYIEQFSICPHSIKILQIITRSKKKTVDTKLQDSITSLQCLHHHTIDPSPPSRAVLPKPLAQQTPINQSAIRTGCVPSNPAPEV